MAGWDGLQMVYSMLKCELFARELTVVLELWQTFGTEPGQLSLFSVPDLYLLSLCACQLGCLVAGLRDLI